MVDAASQRQIAEIRFLLLLIVALLSGLVFGRDAYAQMQVAVVSFVVLVVGTRLARFVRAGSA